MDELMDMAENGLTKLYAIQERALNN
jgi:hypothetical protein